MPLKEKLDHQLFVSFTATEADKIEDAAERLGVSKSAIIRACAMDAFDKVVAREIRRTKRRTKQK